ncbi:MAG TPA: tRNA (N(6)-L-threonylcarbamoyladenosine(37)-C(2))-methylthiotransferase MtaB, partial [Ktedonobacter sp.]|nr:tRNA (N(6)-L-threonylcarbamoyladenosine(37)-C(2))-methylthiotransferase MtaB [Ktedonobacter sp.]
MLDQQHIGSDKPIAVQNEPQNEPQPDNLSTLSPFTHEVPERFTSRTRVQMKVQDGCDNRCTYCIVP